MNRLYFSKLILLCLLALGLFMVTSCNDDDDLLPSETRLAKEFDAQVPLEWYQLFLDLDRISPGYRPPAAARMLGYVGLAAYEAAVPGMPEYNSLEFEFAGLNIPSIEKNKDYHWPMVALLTGKERRRKLFDSIPDNLPYNRPK